MTDKKLRYIRKMIKQFQAINFHSRKETNGTYTILLKDIILVGSIPEEQLRDYITNEINACLKRVAGKMENYLTEIAAAARQVDLDFYGEGVVERAQEERLKDVRKSPYEIFEKHLPSAMKFFRELIAKKQYEAVSKKK